MPANKDRLRATPGTVTIFIVAFLATDYFWYKQGSKYIKSQVWPRVLGRNSAADQPSDR